MRFSKVRRIFTTHLGHLGAERLPEDFALCGHFTLPIANDTGTLSTIPPVADQNPLSIAKRRASEKEREKRDLI